MAKHEVTVRFFASTSCIHIHVNIQHRSVVFNVVYSCTPKKFDLILRPLEIHFPRAVGEHYMD